MQPHLKITSFVQPHLYTTFVQLLSLQQLKYTTPKLTTTHMFKTVQIYHLFSTTHSLQLPKDTLPPAWIIGVCVALFL